MWLKEVCMNKCCYPHYNGVTRIGEDESKSSKDGYAEMYCMCKIWRVDRVRNGIEILRSVKGVVWANHFIKE